jgi:hypothetical protein
MDNFSKLFKVSNLTTNPKFFTSLLITEVPQEYFNKTETNIKIQEKEL